MKLDTISSLEIDIFVTQIELLRIIKLIPRGPVKEMATALKDQKEQKGEAFHLNKILTFLDLMLALQLAINMAY